MTVRFEDGYTGDGLTHQAEEESAEQEACERAVVGFPKMAEYMRDLIKPTDLKRGIIVVFDQVPPGSYLSVGIEYRVNFANKRYVDFRRVSDESCGTGENRAMLFSAVIRRVRCS